MSVGRICQREIDVIQEGDTALTASRRMHQRGVGTLVVIDPDSRKPVGIVTDRDLVVRVMKESDNPAATPVGDIMSAPVKTASEDAPIENVLERMQMNGIRRMVVVDAEEKLVGLVALDDIILLLAEEFRNIGRLLGKQLPQSLGILQAE